MTRTFSFVICLTCVVLCASCGNPAGKDQSPQQPADSGIVVKKVIVPSYKALKFVDNYIAVHDSDIKKNSALKDQDEAECTKQILPVIDKQGLYDDLPFTLFSTTTHEGTAYGNFIYEDDKHFVKVECIIPADLLKQLKENDRYLIKFKAVKFTDGVSFNNEFSKIELPTVDANLLSFSPANK
jgi:hypothetical protein